MIINEIVWIRQFAEKIEREHQVMQHEVYELFLNNPVFRFAEVGDIPGEDLYRALGQTDAGRYLVVFFLRKPKGRALIISARDATKGERRHYG